MCYRYCSPLLARSSNLAPRVILPTPRGRSTVAKDQSSHGSAPPIKAGGRSYDLLFRFYCEKSWVTASISQPVVIVEMRKSGYFNENIILVSVCFGTPCLVMASSQHGGASPLQAGIRQALHILLFPFHGEKF